ncbi:MAG: flagellar type III secretion system pore protein FliP [Alphaproteobacteria bacterium]
MRIILPLILFFCCADLSTGQSLTLDMGEGGSMVGRVVLMFALITIISLAPSILVMMTSFTRIVVALSFLRSALGLQQSPPNIVLISLAMFLTFFIMAPTLEKAYDDGLAPYIAEQIDEEEAFSRTAAPLREFMLKQVREKDLQLFMDIAKIESVETPEETPLRTLIPAFMISELKKAFEIGFLLFLPFIIIDMIVASILMSMGMMMVPPIMIALPFKLIFFVLIDGWHMIAGSLVKGFGL